MSEDGESAAQIAEHLNLSEKSPAPLLGSGFTFQVIGNTSGYTGIRAICSDPFVYLCTPSDLNREPTD